MALTAWQPVGAQPPFEVSYFGLIPGNTASKSESFLLPKGKYIIIPMVWGRGDFDGVYSIGTVSTSPSVSPISEETIATSVISTVQKAQIKKYVYNFTESTTVTINFLCTPAHSSALWGYAYLAIPYNNYTLVKAKASTTTSSTEVLTSGKYMVLAMTGGIRTSDYGTGFVITNTITVPSGAKLSEVPRLGSENASCIHAKEAVIQTAGESITITGANSDTPTLWTTYIYLIWKMS